MSDMLNWDLGPGTKDFDSRLKTWDWDRNISD